jgi:putative ABC transport system substrate-binding protein
MEKSLVNRRLILLSSILFFVGPLIFSCNTKSDKLVIGYIQITPDPILDVAKTALFKALKDSGFVDNLNITILDKNAQGDLSMIPMILQSFISQQVDIVITNSTPCMVAAAQMVKDIPIVFTVAFSPDQLGLKKVPENLFGVYDPLRVTEFVDIVQKCIPGLKKIGLPFNNSEPNAVYSSKVFGAEFTRRGIEVVNTSVTSSNDIMMAGQYLVQENVEAFVVTADNTLYLGLNTLANVANKASIPLFVTDPMQTNKGAALGYGTNYERWGYLSGLKAVDILKKRSPNGLKISTTQDYNLIINKKAATLQKLNIPQELSDTAEKILE